MSKAAQIIQPPSPTIRDKFGARPASYDTDAIARAEAALRDLSGNFDSWMDADAERLEQARRKARATGFAETETEELFCRAHDVKGLAATYDYPLATVIAGALCRLIESPGTRALSRNAPGLIEAHVDAIRAIVRGRIKAADDPTGVMLATELRRLVDAMVGPDSPSVY